MQLPPPGVIGAIVQRYARLLSRYGEDLGERPMVLPNNDFFPDEFRSNERALKRLVKRMQRHAGMTDIPIETRLLEDGGKEHGCGSGGCASGGCGPSGHSKGAGGCSCGKESCEDCDGHDHPPPRLVDEGEQWVMQIPEAETRNAVVLTTNVARSLGYVFLVESRAEGEVIDPPLDVTADLASVALGFGVLMLEGSYIFQKSCGGPSVGRVTKLGTGDLAVATALFVARGGHSARAALKELGATQRASFREALAFTESNGELVELLKKEPERLATQSFQMSEPQPWLLRVLGRKKRAQVRADGPGDGGVFEGSLEELENLLSAMPAPRARPPRPVDPKHEELKALVDEALAAPPPNE